jgi:hypothetical protein
MVLQGGGHTAGQGVEFGQRVLTLLESERDRVTHTLSSLAGPPVTMRIENSVSVKENGIL